jgi:hypothetical protein
MVILSIVAVPSEHFPVPIPAAFPEVFTLPVAPVMKTSPIDEFPSSNVHPVPIPAPFPVVDILRSVTEIATLSTLELPFPQQAPVPIVAPFDTELASTIAPPMFNSCKYDLLSPDAGEAPIPVPPDRATVVFTISIDWQEPLGPGPMPAAALPPLAARVMCSENTVRFESPEHSIAGFTVEVNVLVVFSRTRVTELSLISRGDEACTLRPSK